MYKYAHTRGTYAYRTPAKGRASGPASKERKLELPLKPDWSKAIIRKPADAALSASRGRGKKGKSSMREQSQVTSTKGASLRSQQTAKLQRSTFVKSTRPQPPEPKGPHPVKAFMGAAI